MYWCIVAFIFGLLIGSFLNVCIYRIPRKESIVWPPSHCPVCGKNIKPYDNIPVISYLILKGKCRYCGSTISIRYPLIELLTGILTSLVICIAGLTTYSFVGLTVIYVLITLIGIIATR